MRYKEGDIVFLRHGMLKVKIISMDLIQKTYTVTGDDEKLFWSVDEYEVLTQEELLNQPTDKLKMEAVEHPQHYGGSDNTYEAIKVIEAHGLDFLEGNVVKYLLRYKKKNGLEDLKKAQWYLNRLVAKHDKTA